MADSCLERSMSLISGLLAVMFQDREFRTELPGPLLVFPDHRDLAFWGRAWQPGISPHVQVDIFFRTPSGRIICESFAGMDGASDEERIFDALDLFSRGTLLVLLSAYFGRPDAVNVLSETWTIGGVPRQVHLGPLTFRYGAPGGRAPDNPFLDRWFGWIDELVERSTFPPGDHWVRIYRCQNDGQPLGGEVLLDNEVWPEAEAELFQLNWPPDPDPSDARVFLVVRDQG